MTHTYAPVNHSARERLIALAAQASVRAQEATTKAQAGELLAAAGRWITVVALLTPGGVPARPFIVPALVAADEHATAAGDLALPPAREELLALLYG